MGKGRYFGRLVAVAAVVAAVGLGGCGTSNDQGISFRAIGWFEDGTASAGDTGDAIDINTDDTVPSDDDGDGELDGGFLGLENNMLQGINVERVDLSYVVSGSSLNIPSDAFPLSVRLGPASGQEQSSPRGFFQIIIVSPQTIEFLDQNRSRLPEFPFTLVARASAIGVTDSGDPFRTNTISFTVIVQDVPPPTPTPAPTPEPTPAP